MIELVGPPGFEPGTTGILADLGPESGANPVPVLAYPASSHARRRAQIHNAIRVARN